MARGSKKKAMPFNPADLASIANMAKSNPFVQQLANDARLRKNVRTAVSSGKSAYARVSNGKVPTRALLEDRKLHADVLLARVVFQLLLDVVFFGGGDGRWA